MTATRLSRLQRRMLRYVYETEVRSGGIVSVSLCPFWSDRLDCPYKHE